MLLEDRELTEQAAHIEALLDDVESVPDPAVRAKTAEIVQGLLALYGQGLARMLAIVGQQAEHEAGTRIIEAFAADELVSHLLLLHDLHPVDVETRVARALEEVRPYLQSHGGNVELLGVDGGVARLRLQGSCHGCPSSTMTLKLAIEEAVLKAAPDLDGIEADGVAEPPPNPAGFVPVSTLVRKAAQPMETETIPATGPARPAQQARPAWIVVEGLPPLADGGMAALDVAGQSTLFINFEGAFYAYGNACAICGQSLEQGALHGTDLACPTCGRHYDARQAGRCLDTPDVSLQPVPLLVHGDSVKVALNDQPSAVSHQRLSEA